MGSADQEEFEREYKEKQLQNRGGNNIIQKMDNQQENNGGQQQQQPYYNKKQGNQKIVWEQIKLPPLNITIEKVWEAVILMEDIPEPFNLGNELPSGRRSKDFCTYHHFHGHTTHNCRNVRKIILQMIEQGKLNHFLAQHQHNLPPPPLGGNTYNAEKGKNTYVIEVDAKSKNLYCNSIIHSFKNIEAFHDNILSRVHARDNDGREILNLAKISPLKDWQKQVISFIAEETPRGGESHESPLVVRLGINPKEKLEDNDKEEEYDANVWAIDRILIDPGSSVDILFDHTYNTTGGKDNELIPSTYKIYGFNGSANKPKGEVTMRIPLKNLSTKITFCVVDIESPYNALIGRPWLHGILGVSSIFHK
ncbi:uncharacterized protein LOC113329192 [Papaver somniferum]|uniref:uncharacterized protein LOC113329192 n=1 Tax=Papaver somniferum TaxID=3469 RepID=UPI000E700620|nr:uncharacterized protein LOC113329192 [Papaver somniferum]